MGAVGKGVGGICEWCHLGWSLKDKEESELQSRGKTGAQDGGAEAHLWERLSESEEWKEKG